MLPALTRRAFLHGAALGGVALGFTAPEPAEAAGPQVYGVGRIGDNLPGVTLPSPSDFGFTAHADGGAFLCSMFGPETGGFLGCNLMTVQGVVTPGTLAIQKKTATFSGLLDLFMYPNIFMPPEPFLNAAQLPFEVRVTFGGPGKGTMVLRIPDVTANVGGDTGGTVRVGRIERRKIKK